MSNPTCAHMTAQVVHEGIAYETFCGAPIVARYADGSYKCLAHAPSVIYNGTIAPSPDPAKTMAALAATPPQAYVPHNYGVAGQDADLAVRKVRVNKAHKDAVLEVMEDAAALITVSGMVGFAEVMAAAVLGAEDSVLRYVVGVRVPGAGPLIFGPYATDTSAQTALDDGHIPAYKEGMVGAVYPLTPTPKATRKPADNPLTKKKRKTATAPE